MTDQLKVEESKKPNIYTRIAAAVGVVLAVTAGTAAFTGHLATIVDHVSKVFSGSPPAPPAEVEIGIRDVSITLGEAGVPPEGEHRNPFNVTQKFYVTLVLEKKGGGLVRNCVGEALFRGKFWKRSADYRSQLVSFDSGRSAQKAARYEFQVNYFLYDFDNPDRSSRFRVICDDLISPSVGIKLPPPPLPL